RRSSIAAITGLRTATQGTITISGKNVVAAPPRQISELGVGHIPEDRQREGLVTSYPLTANAVLELYYQEPFARGIVTDERAVLMHANELIKDFDVRTPSAAVAASSLSGGNQQKLIVAREFSRPLKLLVASQPTRGIDVGSIEFIHQQIVRKRDEGVAVLVVSAELDEILALSDRIAVMNQGRIVATIPAAEADRERLGLLMGGVASEVTSSDTVARGDGDIRWALGSLCRRVML
ncbi:ATP-binding cassette domain-containing protein, partial [Candidatus Gracilibacteria bacterium]|nr:ATP-binding cassette domain-containing protein [Candidatus Gracilibacteria bacterium]